MTSKESNARKLYKPELQRFIADRWWWSPHTYPIIWNANAVYRDEQTLKEIAKEINRPWHGVARQITYYLTAYNEDYSRIAAIRKFMGLKSTLNPDRPIDFRVQMCYAFSRGSRVKPSRRFTKIGTQNPKMPLPDEVFQTLAWLNDDAMDELRDWYSIQSPARVSRGLFKNLRRMA
jgi:hypothetical protein